MQINNPLQINDWEIKKFLKFILAIQLALWGVIGLDAIGLQISIIRQLVGFIYLTFIPGIIILRILKLHKLCNIETLLYTVGLSITTLMFMGLFMNTLYPLVGISGPISITPLIITISVIVLVLCVLSYIRDKDFSEPSIIDVREVLSPPVLFLCLIPFMTVLGTYLVNFHHNNILLMLMIVVVALVALLIIFDKFIPKNLYPLAVFVIAISLLYHNSLISMYLTGNDIHTEYYFHKLVMINAHWDSTIIGNTNSMLSIAILPAIYSLLLNMEGTWIFKVVYPLLYSLVPLGLYCIFYKQTSEKTAFLAVFFFVSINIFYNVLPSLAREEIAELFCILVMLIMINRKIDLFKGTALFIIFNAGMIVSHYGLSYIFMFSYPIALAILYINKDRSKILNTHAVILFTVMILSWYIYIGSSHPFNTIVNIGSHIYENMFIEFLNPNSRESVVILVERSSSLFRWIYRIIYYVLNFFMVVGVIELIFNRKKTKFFEEYNSLSIVFFVIALATLLVPFLSDQLWVGRTYHIITILLAPFCILGGESIFRLIFKIGHTLHHIPPNPKRIHKVATDPKVVNPKIFVSVILLLFFLFNTGFIFEIAKDRPTSISLSMDTVDEYNEQYNISLAWFYVRYTPEEEIFSAKWLSKNKNDNSIVYATYADCRIHALQSYGLIHLPYVHSLSNSTKKIDKNNYIYLGYVNIVLGWGMDMGTELEQTFRIWNITENPIIFNNNKIYANGGSEIRYVQ